MKHHHLRLFLIFSFSLLNFSLSAQSWEPVGGGLTGEDTSIKEVVNALCVYNNKLYVGGCFTRAGKLNANYIASWDGTKWDSLGCGTNGPVKALCVYKHWLALGGDFNTVGRKRANRVALCIDSTDMKPKWFNLGKGILNFRDVVITPDISSLIEYNGFLYVRGYFTDVGTITSNGIAKWNGNTGWLYNEKFGRATSGNNIGEGPLFIYKNQLCLGGFNPYLDGCNPSSRELWTWDDNVIKTETIPDGPLGIACITSADSCMYIGGISNTAGHGVFKWNGKTWLPLGELPHWNVKAIVEYNGKLYIGGSCPFSSNKRSNCVACWDGYSWKPVGAGLSTTVKWHKAYVQSLCVYKGELYASGYFTNSGGNTVMNIAKLKLDK